MGKNTKSSFWQGLLSDSTQLLGVAVIAGILAIILPIPVVLLDFFQVFNIILAVLIMMTVVNSRSILDFSIFPTILLFTTLFRLVVNVSSTRLILLEGSSFNGKVISAFANFVIGGNYVVGFIIFIVITAVLFIVINKGSTRVSEVSARFALDAMPQKQLAIDTELSQGLIDEKKASQRRESIQEEAAFYGNMDGASKFVSGDIKVGVVITIINIIGGLITGMVMRGEDINTAIDTYVKLCIGDGLVSQIPSLLISVAAGVIVTKNISRDGLGSQLKEQIFSKASTMYFIGGFIFILSFFASFPKLIFWISSGLMFYIGYRIKNIDTSEESQKQQETSEKTEKDIDFSDPKKMVELVQVDPLEIELGYSLIPLVDKSSGGDLLERIKKCRKQIVMELGLIVPQVRITDNMELEPQEYTLKINGDKVGGSLLEITKLLAINGSSTRKIEGIETIEPVFNLPAYWIDKEQKDQAVRNGYTVFDGPTIVATHLTEIIKRHASEFLGRKEVRNLMNSVEKRNSVIIEELKNHKIESGYIQKVLQELIVEGISIRNIESILEAIIDNFSRATGAEHLSELVRARLKRQISANFADSNNKLHTMVFNPELEEKLVNSVSITEAGYNLDISPDGLNQLVKDINDSMIKMGDNGFPPLLMTNGQIRRPLKTILSSKLPSLNIISYSEIAKDYELDFVDTI